MERIEEANISEKGWAGPEVLFASFAIFILVFLFSLVEM